MEVSSENKPSLQLLNTISGKVEGENSATLMQINSNNLIGALLAQKSAAAFYQSPASSSILHNQTMTTAQPSSSPAPNAATLTQVFRVYTLPTSDGCQLVVQADAPTATLKVEASSAPDCSKRFSNSPPSSIPLKKRRHRYDDSDERSLSPQPIVVGRNNVVSSSTSTNNSDDDEDDAVVVDDDDRKIQPQINNGQVYHQAVTTKRPYHHQPKDLLPDEMLKKMSPEEIKRERNRLAADRCRKKKLAKIEQLTNEVNQMERQRRKVLHQLDSLRHAALAARDAIRSHKAAGCSLDETGALSRLIEQTETLDNFVRKEQF